MSNKVTWAKIKETLSLKLNTIATKLNTFAHSTLGATMLSVAAAAAVVAVAVAVSIKLYNKDAEAAEKAANASKMAADAAEEASSKYQTLKDTMDPLHFHLIPGRQLHEAGEGPGCNLCHSNTPIR